MKFKVSPNTLIKCIYTVYGRPRVHYFGTSDDNGILTVSDTDPYLPYLKANYKAVDETKSEPVNMTDGQETELETTKEAVNNGDNRKKRGRPRAGTSRKGKSAGKAGRKPRK